ncbi:hypothetical protein NBO_427g0005 [Nosema bombycis CQ1]|uniref:Uncharacterized protein n=1 Tax=Nosema bombycis (strain CQ1 / CVCC 102059) TaxID=578461 RepID=R0MI70_NOSB1|nr:hypothetical protein NBO_427g0005 [Nosema bombycis CQ1]|eukprot:EOB12488.1 hypothetical protein NBO_427g0005 [Nosema bombycis CQ1]
MGNFCSCLNTKKPKCIVSIIGLEEDVKQILNVIVPNFDPHICLSKFSEYPITYNNAEIIINAHINNSLIKNLINLHSKSEFASIYAINADNKLSLESARNIMDDQERIQGKLISVLCKGKYLDSPGINELKVMFQETIHDSFDFVKYTDEEVVKTVKMTFDKIHNRLSE